MVVLAVFVVGSVWGVAVALVVAWLSRADRGNEVVSPGELEGFKADLLKAMAGLAKPGAVVTGKAPDDGFTMTEGGFIGPAKPTQRIRAGLNVSDNPTKGAA